MPRVGISFHPMGNKFPSKSDRQVGAVRARLLPGPHRTPRPVRTLVPPGATHGPLDATHGPPGRDSASIDGIVFRSTHLTQTRLEPLMLKTRTQRIMLLLLLLAIPGASAGTTTEYSVRGLGQLVPGGSSIAYGVNDLGVAVGTATNAQGSYTAVRFNLDGTVTDLGQLYPGYESAALDINNAGTIVGWAFTGYQLGNVVAPVFVSNAVVFNGDGTLTNLGLLIPSVSASARAHAINNHGVIVGSATDNDDVSRAVIFEGGGVITPLGYLGLSPQDSFASAINDDGVIVGTSSLSKVNNAVQFHLDGSVTDLFSQREASSAYGISSTGEIVGSAKTPASQPSPLIDFGTLFDGSGGATGLGQLDSGRPAMALAVNASGTIVGFGDTEIQRTAVLFDRDAGTVVPLTDQIEAAEPVAWILETAYAINDSGQIVGGGKPNPGDPTGYILTPVPEPAAALLALAALIAVQTLARHRSLA